jgi:hypothetical protein
VAPPSSTRNTRSRNSLQLPEPYDVPDEAPADSFVQVNADYIQELDELEGDSEQVYAVPEPMSRRKATPNIQPPQEITESPLDAPGSGRRQSIDFEKAKTATRISQDVKSSRKAVRTPVVAKTPKQQVRGKGKGRGRPPKQSPMQVGSGSSQMHTDGSLFDEVDELSPEQPRDRRDEQFSDAEDVEEVAEDIDDIETARRIGLIKASKKPQYTANEADDDEQESDQDELTPKPAKSTIKSRKRSKMKAQVQAQTSPAVQRQPKKPKSRGPISEETIPVMVHRLSKPLVYAEDDNDADILNMEIPFAKRGGVNAVDVLAQICEEVIDSGLTTLEDGMSNTEASSTRKEYRTKLRAVEAFQEELRTTLLELVSCT